MKTQCVFFDLDGTLVDTAPDLGFALNEVRRERGLPPLADAEIRPFASTGTRGLLGLSFGAGHPDYKALSERFLAIYGANSTRASRPFAGILALLTALSERDIRWGVVTNKSRAFTEPLIAHIQWPVAPIAVACADEVGKGKPDPASLLLACERACVKPQHCVYVGDAYRDIEAGRRAGMPTIGVTYGYTEHDSPPQDWKADILVDTPAQILKAVLGLSSEKARHA